MPQEDRVARYAQYARIATLFVSALVFLLGSGVFWKFPWDAPDVRYNTLPTYEVQGKSVGIVIVQNAGGATADKVYVYVRNLRAPLDILEVKTDEPYHQQGGVGFNFVSLYLERLTPSSRVSLLLQVPGPLSLSEEQGTLSVTWQGGRARRSEEPSGFSAFPYLIGMVSGVVLWSLISNLLTYVRRVKGSGACREAARVEGRVHVAQEVDPVDTPGQDGSPS